LSFPICCKFFMMKTASGDCACGIHLRMTCCNSAFTRERWLLWHCRERKME
jgi:hypothetical protein